MKKKYFIQKDFIGYPVDVIYAMYENGVWRTGHYLAPRKISKKYPGFDSLEDILSYRYCKCGKSNCAYNTELYNIVNKKISIDHAPVV